MKKIIHSAGLFILAMVYCYANSVATHSIGNLNILTNWNTEEDTYLERVSTSFFFHTPLKEITSSQVQNFSAHACKNLFHFDWAKQKTIEDLFETTYSRYIWRAENFQINYRKADLIFPFQYFW